ncbi:MAG: SDR family oxidoreductase [Betaproteobacteria bacterium]|nr:SDR family oxidoreductase [Betaproteobacteria bacterium]
MRPLVFITGASSGIGQALALRYHHAGWRLALAARRVPEMQAWLETHGVSPELAHCYLADVSDVNSIIAAANECLAEQGVPDVVIANAGISIGMDTQVRQDLEVLQQVMNTNVVGMAATFHPFLHAMKNRAVQMGHSQHVGTLVGIASVAGIRGMPGHAAYCASKAAAIGYCESLRGELKPEGFKVVTLAPGYIKTPLTQKNKFPMPFLMSATDFAEAAFQAIEKGHSFKVIPTPMAWVARVLRILPNTLFDRAFKNVPRKHRSTD